MEPTTSWRRWASSRSCRDARAPLPSLARWYDFPMGALDRALREAWIVGLVGMAALAACESDANVAPDAAASDADSTPTDAPADAAGAVAQPAAWIRQHFTGAHSVTGAMTARTRVETPALVHDASGCCGKYAFDVVETEAPDRREVGFVDVAITDLESEDAFGAGIQAANARGLTLFLAGVTIDPQWPTWVGYSTTNKDGIVLDGAAALYAADLTITNWNADAAIDNKAPLSQLVSFQMRGHGHRGIRYWGAGPHYLVGSTLENTGDLGEGSLLWFADCATAVVKIYDSTFNGAPTLDPAAIACDNGTAPTLEYLTTDPRTTGEMHEMFSYVPAP